MVVCVANCRQVHPDECCEPWSTSSKQASGPHTLGGGSPAQATEGVAERPELAASIVSHAVPDTVVEKPAGRGEQR